MYEGSKVGNSYDYGAVPFDASESLSDPKLYPIFVQCYGTKSVLEA
jgi:hypothetical protein